MKKINFPKSKIFWGMPVVIFSPEAFFGMIAGYFTANFFSKRIRSVAFNIGKYRVHLHHWLFGAGFLLIVIFYRTSPLPIIFSSGFFGGLAFQGIVSYSDWYKIWQKRI